MKILFWNTNRNNHINNYIISLVKDYDVDILIAAEYDSDEQELILGFEQSGLPLEPCNTLGCERLKIWSSYVKIDAGVQHKYYSIQIINDNCILCCPHLPSDLHGDSSEERFAIIQRIMMDINQLKEKIGTQEVVIVGDMNEMPYDKGCLNANGFHGLPAVKLTERASRTVNGTEYAKYYNPMWNLMGDYSYPPGTYYWNASRIKNPMWYMLDQVIISKELIPKFKKEKLKILTTCTYADLMNHNNIPDKHISDHFPIICEIEDEKD